MLNNIRNLDRLEILVNLERMAASFSQDWDVEKLRLLLKKALLEEILKTDIDQHLYVTCLEETLIAINEWGVVDSGYPCCILGCRYKGPEHRNYVGHLKKNHANLKNVLCNFKRECKRRFSSLDDLVQHIKNNHGPSRVNEVSDTRFSTLIDIPCKCDLCSGRNFSNVTELMKHYNTFHNNQYRECIFLGCKVVFGVGSTSRHHFRIKHKRTGSLQLKDRHIVNHELGLIGAEGSNEHGVTDREPLEEEQNEYDTADLDFLDNTSASDEESNEEIGENYFLEYYSDFLNRLVNFKFIPESTVQEISEEYIKNSQKSSENRKLMLQKCLDGSESICQEEKERIIKNLDSDKFLDAQLKLGTEYKRSKFIKESQNFVAPEEILLNKEEVRLGSKKDVFHYIPIVQSFKTLLEDKSFNKMMSLQKRVSCGEKVSDLKDGSVYKTSDYFQANSDAYSILLYSDAVELKNPLGAARGVYKIVQVFYTLADIPKAQRSQVDRLQLVMIFREKLLKKYSLQTIYKRLVTDMKTLEAGIIITLPETRRVRAGVLGYAADNLEASIVGGFSACFSSRDVCRVCHIQHSDLDDHISDYDGEIPHRYWTEQEYDNIVQSLDNVEEDNDDASSSEALREVCVVDGENDIDSDSADSENDSSEGEDDIIDKRGLKSRCPLNTLKSFHREDKLKHVALNFEHFNCSF